MKERSAEGEDVDLVFYGSSKLIENSPSYVK